MASASAPPSGRLGLLDPLSVQEVERAVHAVRRDCSLQPEDRFSAVSTAEPDRALTPQTGRAAEVVVRRLSGGVLEARVDLTRDAVDWSRELAHVQAPIGRDEVRALAAAVRTHPAFVAALERRGISDPSLVDIDPLSSGAYGSEEERAASGRRLARFIAFVRPEPGGNAYSRPLAGVSGLADLATMEILHFEDSGVVPLPDETGEYRSELIGSRKDVRPIHIIQPEGTSFVVDGHQVSWQKWRLSIGYNAREGLTLHDVGYGDGGNVRSVLKRASYAEMVVPYADPARFYQTPLDIGEFNVGTMANSLELGCDCLGEIRYFDAAYANEAGDAIQIDNAICLHEEDDGVNWKHTDVRAGFTEVRRGRRLVISTFVTVGNYEYGFFWYLHQDGVISSEVKATGIVATQAVAAETPYSKLVAPHLAAPHHQHIFCVRLDFALDVGGNSIVETETRSLPVGPDNPYGNAWVTDSHPLATEKAARSDIDAASARSWTVVNPSRLNAVGQPVGYRLIPGENTVPFSAPGSSARRRAGFMEHHLWATRRAAEQRHPAGEYPYQHTGGDGLPRWVESDRPIENTDLVVWYVMNHHHVPRPEDWPVMPVARLGFQLKPWGFFDRNPALDIPPPEGHSSSCHP